MGGWGGGGVIRERERLNLLRSLCFFIMYIEGVCVFGDILISKELQPFKRGMAIPLFKE